MREDLEKLRRALLVSGLILVSMGALALLASSDIESQAPIAATVSHEILEPVYLVGGP